MQYARRVVTAFAECSTVIRLHGLMDEGFSIDDSLDLCLLLRTYFRFQMYTSTIAASYTDAWFMNGRKRGCRPRNL